VVHRAKRRSHSREFKFEAVRRTHEPGKTIADVARELVRKGVLQRVRRGLYLVRPLRTLLRPSTPSTALIASVLLRGQPYYLGGPWAASFHGLTDQR
jgi:predicted transcriptional regulator of viral defense system